MPAAATEGSPLQSYCEDANADVVRRPTLSVLSLNISHGRNTALNQLLVSKKQTYANLDAVARLLEQSGADVAGIQEADAPSRWSGGFDHVRYLSDSTRFGCVVHGLHSASWISTYGAALISGAKLSQPESIRFPPSPPSKQKGFVAARIKWQPTADLRLTVRVVSVHLDFLSESTRDVQVDTMISKLAADSGPLIIMGDLNSEWSTPDSHVRALAEGLGLHAYRPESDGLGTYKGTGGKRLDWILASPEVEFVRYEVLPTVVSDHYAVLAEFRPGPGVR